MRCASSQRASRPTDAHIFDSIPNVNRIDTFHSCFAVRNRVLGGAISERRKKMADWVINARGTKENTRRVGEAISEIGSRTKSCERTARKRNNSEEEKL